MSLRFAKFFSFSVASLVGIASAGAVVFAEELLAPARIAASVTTLRSPRETLEISFSLPVNPESVMKHFLISPSVPVRFQWNADRTRLSLAPEIRWEDDTRYAVSISGGKTAIGRAFPATSFTFALGEFPTVVSVAPANGAEDILLGIEDPIVVRFRSSARDFYVDFRFDPDVPVAYENNPEKTEFRLLPTKPLTPGAAHTLRIFVRWKGEDDETYRKIAETSFTTLPERPEKWNSDLSARLAETRRYARALLREGKYIDINLESQVMTAFEDGKLLDTYLVSSGQRGMETPKGVFKIENKADRPWSRRYNLFMPYWMAISSDGRYGIHELPEWPGGYKEGANHLGRPVSHGCVRLGIGAAERIFRWADVGTPVIVH